MGKWFLYALLAACVAGAGIHYGKARWRARLADAKQHLRETLIEERSDLLARISSLRDCCDDLRARLDRANTRLARTLDELTLEREAQDPLRDQLRGLQAETLRFEARIGSEVSEHEKTKTALAEMTSARQKLARDSERVTADLAASNRKVEEGNQRIDALQSRLEQAETQSRETAETAQKLTETAESLRAQMVSARQTITKRESERDTARSEIESLRRELNALKTESD